MVIQQMPAASKNFVIGVSAAVVIGLVGVAYFITGGTFQFAGVGTGGGGGGGGVSTPLPVVVVIGVSVPLSSVGNSLIIGFLNKNL